MWSKLFYKLSNHSSDNPDEFDLNDLNKIERRILLFSGLYPLKSKNKLSSLWHLLRGVFTTSCFLIIVVTLSLSLAFETETMPEMAEVLIYLITMCSVLLKTCNFLVNRGMLLTIEEHLRNPLSYKFYKIFGTRGIDDIIHICNIMAVVLRVAISFFGLFYAGIPVFQPNSPLPFPGWWGVDEIEYHNLLLPIQSIAVLVSANVNSTFDLYAAYCISIGVGQLRLLKTCLANVYFGTAKDELYAAGEKGQIKISSEHLNDIVRLHHHVLTYIEMVEDMFSYGIFVQFFASIGVICLIGFLALVLDPSSGDFFVVIVYTVCVMAEVVLYCWYGNEILFESSGIVEACYMSNWYEGTQSEKKVLFLIMERSQKNVMITAGKFFTLSLATLLMIMRTSYSYFAVLQQYYKDKDFT